MSEKKNRNTAKKLFVMDAIERGKSIIEAREEYEALTSGGAISPTYWDNAMDEFHGEGGDRNEAAESIIKDIKLESKQEPEEKEEEEEWVCSQCGKEGKGQPPAYCPGCGVEFNLE